MRSGVLSLSLSLRRLLLLLEHFAFSGSLSSACVFLCVCLFVRPVSVSEKVMCSVLSAAFVFISWHRVSCGCIRCILSIGDISVWRLQSDAYISGQLCGFLCVCVFLVPFSQSVEEPASN